jgi:hypothetical protein
MNDKCCMTCAGRDGYQPCPFDYCDGRAKPNGWNDHGNYCNEFTPLPDKPGKIEPLSVNLLSATQYDINLTVKAAINQLIAAHNGRDGK